MNDKQPGRTYYAGNGQTLAMEDPGNPYGRVWIGLGGELSIHGQPSTAPVNSAAGCISLSPTDAGDVYGILSKGSTVSIVR